PVVMGSAYAVPVPRSSAVLAIPPRQPGVQLRQLVVGSVRADREQAGTCLVERLGLLTRCPAHRHRDLDLGDVAAHLLAVTSKDPELAVEGLDVGERVPDGGVLRDDPQRLAL